MEWGERDRRMSNRSIGTVPVRRFFCFRMMNEGVAPVTVIEPVVVVKRSSSLFFMCTGYMLLVELEEKSYV